MPSTIPYDPTLTLGNVVDPKRLAVLEQIRDLQAPVDAAQDRLNNAILLRRSLDMTRQELVNLQIDPSSIDAGRKSATDQVKKAAKGYADTAVRQLPQIADVRSKLQTGGEAWESPIDYVRSRLAELPLSADSIKLNAQYFSFSENSQKASSQMAALKAFVAAETSALGAKRSVQASTEAQRQTNSQRENHSVEGTLVITATCTHKVANVWAPFILDVEKGIRVWNRMFPEKRIKVDSVASMREIAAEEGTADEASMQLLSGVTLGSSFVGMVHTLKSSSTVSSQQMASVASSLQAQMKAGGWFAKASGGFGVASSFANSAKNLLSQASVSSHISMVCMGLIPSIKANDVKMAVKQFTEFDPQAQMERLATLQNATAGGQQSMDSAAAAARTGNELVSLENAKIKAVLSGVGEMQAESNKMLDINSLIEAFEDFVNKAAEGKAGVPINYYLQPITRAQLAQMWVAKYIPEYLQISGDDADKG